MESYEPELESYEPELPIMTVSEIEEQNYVGYQIIMEVARQAALVLYNASHITNKLGLEKCMEAIIDLLDTGYAKILWAEDPDGDIEEDMVCIGYFNSFTGKYQIPGCEEECDEKWDSFSEF